MNESSRSLGVLEKLLKMQKSPDVKPAPAFTKKAKLPKGRPKVADDKKARNFTLCLAKNYLDFLDKMTVRDPKVQGRGRKIRFIIDRFLVHEKRQIKQLRTIRESLKQLDQVLKSFSGKKLELSPKEKQLIDQHVKQLETLTTILAYSPKELQKLLPREEWALMSFCFDWNRRRGVVL